MYYRYEAKNEKGEYEGIFSFFNPDERRYFNRYVKEPIWYKNNPGVDSKCWFTEEGYYKYHHIIDAIITNYDDLRREVRIITKDTLDNIVCKGKIQCIELIQLI